MWEDKISILELTAIIVLDGNQRTPLKTQMHLSKLLCIKWAVGISNSCWEFAQSLSSAETIQQELQQQRSGLVSPFQENRKSLAAGHRGSEVNTGPIFLEGSITKKVTCPSVQQEGDGQCISLNLCLVHVKMLSVTSLTPLCRFASSECWNFSLWEASRQRIFHSFFWQTHPRLYKSYSIKSICLQKIATAPLWLIWQEGNRIINSVGIMKAFHWQTDAVGDVKENELFRIRKLGKQEQILYHIQLS